MEGSEIFLSYTSARQENILSSARNTGADHEIPGEQGTLLRYYTIAKIYLTKYHTENEMPLSCALQEIVNMFGTFSYSDPWGGLTIFPITCYCNLTNERENSQIEFC